MKTYVVTYKVTKSILVSAPSPERAATRAVTVAEHSYGDKDIEIVKVSA